MLVQLADLGETRPTEISLVMSNAGFQQDDEQNILFTNKHKRTLTELRSWKQAASFKFKGVTSSFKGNDLQLNK